VNAEPTWCDRARARLLEMETLIRAGRGNERVSGGGCTEPGGGIVPAAPTANKMAETLRHQLAAAACFVAAPAETISLGGTPTSGFGQTEALVAPIMAAPSPWAVALTTSVMGAAAGWMIEEIARTVRSRSER
jgi:hypothetical protein